MAEIKFTAKGSGAYSITGGAVEKIVSPIPEKGIMLHRGGMKEIIMDGETFVFDFQNEIYMPIVDVPFIFNIADGYAAVVGVTRMNAQATTSVSGVEITTKNCMMQVRTKGGVTENDRIKNEKFYKGATADVRLDPLYWAVAVAINEYGVKYDGNTFVSYPSNNTYTIDAHKMGGSWLGLDGGASIMGSGNWVDTSPYFANDNYEKYINSIFGVRDDKPSEVTTRSGLKFPLPRGVKCTGEFDGLLQFEYKNGKVKTGSALGLLNYKERDPKLLSLVEEELKAARALSAALEIFAESLRQDGQTIQSPKQKRKRRPHT